MKFGKNLKFWGLGALAGAGLVFIAFLPSIVLPTVWAYENEDYIFWMATTKNHVFQHQYSKGCVRMREYAAEHGDNSAFIVCNNHESSYKIITQRNVEGETVTLSTKYAVQGEKGPDYVDVWTLESQEDGSLIVTKGNGTPITYEKATGLSQMAFWKSTIPRYLAWSLIAELREE